MTQTTLDLSRDLSEANAREEFYFERMKSAQAQAHELRSRLSNMTMKYAAAMEMSAALTDQLADARAAANEYCGLAISYRNQRDEWQRLHWTAYKAECAERGIDPNEYREAFGEC